MWKWNNTHNEQEKKTGVKNLGSENDKHERNEKKGNKLTENEIFRCILRTSADESEKLKNNKTEEINPEIGNVEIDEGNNIKILTMSIAKEIENNGNDAIGMSDTWRTIKKIMNEWMENVTVIDVVDEKYKVTARNQNCSFGARVVGNCNKQEVFL